MSFHNKLQLLFREHPTVEVSLTLVALSVGCPVLLSLRVVVRRAFRESSNGKKSL